MELLIAYVAQTLALSLNAVSQQQEERGSFSSPSFQAELWMFPQVLALIICGFLSYMLFKMSSSRNSVSQGRMISFFIVVFAIGAILIITSYNGLLHKPLQAFGFQAISSTSAVELHQSEEAIKQAGKEQAVSHTSQPYFYGVMFDAGSTGSRVHAFKFKKSEPGKPFELINALFKYNSEGLSSFAESPEKGAESISKLLDEAKLYVPEYQWERTPVALKATAGLRALPEQQSTALLDEVSKLFKNCPFKVEENAVSIMDGDEEGIFSWFTLNFLMGALGDMSKMVGAMDLGGGSTQITFVAGSEQKKPKYVQELDIFGKKFPVYTHSYLGLGLMAGRFQTLGGKEPASGEKGPFTTPCTAKDESIPFTYQGKTFNVTGKAVEAATRYDECKKVTDAIVKASNIDQPTEVSTLPFTIYSYYYDRAVDAQLIDESKGGDIIVKDFEVAARKECENLLGKKFMCLDLTYITSLLTTGFNFSPETKILLRKKINDYEISWALGAMFQLLKE